MRKLYMHTMRGQPAFFSKRDGQIVFADILPHWQDKPAAAVLRASVRQIRADQRRTKLNRESWKMRYDQREYGWVQVLVPDAPRPAPTRKATRAGQGGGGR